MRLYKWSSAALKNYSNGEDCAVGIDIDAARANARSQFPDVVKGRWEWIVDSPDEDDQKEYQDKLNALEQDILAEPEVDIAFFVHGGE